MTPWTGACQAPLSMEFSRQEYWSGLPFSPPGDLPGDPGIGKTHHVLCFLLCRQILYPLSHWGSLPRKPLNSPRAKTLSLFLVPRLIIGAGSHVCSPLLQTPPPPYVGGSGGPWRGRTWPTGTRSPSAPPMLGECSIDFIGNWARSGSSNRQPCYFLTGHPR